MFTGLVEATGRVEGRRQGEGGDVELQIGRPDAFGALEIGESIAVDGVCLTVTEADGERFSVDVSVETCDRMTIGRLSEGDAVHLERALRAGDRLGGHFVQGHVDGVGELRGREPDGDGLRLSFSVPDDLARYLVEKGSVAVDGVSLTVNDRDDAGFSVMIVPHTAEVTKLGEIEAGAEVNIEVDMIGKYVEQLMNYED